MKIVQGLSFLKQFLGQYSARRALGPQEVCRSSSSVSLLSRVICHRLITTLSFHTTIHSKSQHSRNSWLAWETTTKMLFVLTGRQHCLTKTSETEPQGQGSRPTLVPLAFVPVTSLRAFFSSFMKWGPGSDDPKVSSCSRVCFVLKLYSKKKKKKYYKLNIF